MPLVVLEPGCLSVFRDELGQLFPDDPRALRLRSKAVSLSEFLMSEGARVRTVGKRSVMHGHCHQKAL